MNWQENHSITMKKHFAIAVVGLAGSGKTELVRFFEKEYELPNVYFGKYVLDEVKRRNLPVTEQNERVVREELRQQHGMAAMAVLSWPVIEQHLATSHILIESLYSWEEYRYLKDKLGDHFKVLARYASPELRYERLAMREERPLAKAEAEARDIREIEMSHKAGPIVMADELIGPCDDKEDLYRQGRVAYEQLIQG